MKRTVWIMLLVIIGIIPVQYDAQDNALAPFPTVQALNEAVLPPRDALDLARRLEGVTTVEPPPINPPTLTVGTIKTFWVDNSTDNFSFQMNAELRVVGDHIYLWVEQGENVPLDGLQRLADEFDRFVYDEARAIWGSEASPGVDGDPRVHGLFATALGSGIGAYFSTRNTFPVEAVPTSNEHEMFFYNLDAIRETIGTDYLTTITAHEFQHMIRANVDPNEEGWIDEGFSSFTEMYLGSDDVSQMLIFQTQPNNQLNAWTEDGNRNADYGAAHMFVAYLYERFGRDGLHQLSLDPANGFVGVDNLARAHGTDINTLFADWVVANLILNPTRSVEGIYGYTLFSGLQGPLTSEYYSLPISENVTVNQYGAEYLGLRGVHGLSELSIRVEAPQVVPLAEVISLSGTPMAYSNRGDDSDTRLTFPVDLTNAQNPVLQYDLWYHIERWWDYGFVMISTDNGETWETLPAPDTTTENPHFMNWGHGYTGVSGGDEVSQWVREEVSLASYAGQPVLIRFEMITDDGVNQPGMFIDQVTVMDGDTIMRTTDFSDPSQLTDWVAEGWIYTDNRLPQQVWIQAVQQQADYNTVSRWLLTEGSAEYTLPLTAQTDRVVLIIAPTAPVTTVPVDVSIQVIGR